MTVDSQHSLISKLKPGRIISLFAPALAVVVWFIVKIYGCPCNERDSFFNFVTWKR
jgi:hypothetical protein